MFSKVIVVVVLAVLATASAKSKKGHEEAIRQKKRDAPIDLQVRQVAPVGTVCSAKEFNCSAYSCIPKHYVCDTENDCFNDADEQNCPTDCSGPNQFKCNHNNKCISSRAHCDGHPDCLDWSDEANCAEFDCLEGFTHCVSTLECIRESYRCDGDNDCEDASDEAGCPDNPATCLTDQFHCAHGAKACVPNEYLCDGDKDCGDGSDEVGCTCESHELACKNGGCILDSWKCDGDNDCGDMSDELGCPEHPSHVCYDVLTAMDCIAMNETAHPICTIHADGHKYCRKFCNLCDGPSGATVAPAGK